MAKISSYRNLMKLRDLQISHFPSHREFLERRFEEVDKDHLSQANDIAGLIERIAGDQIGQVLNDYVWLTEIVLQEEFHFRRTGKYRLTSFDEAERTIYSNDDYMHRYMNGLLVSLIWWRNHFEAICYYKNVFLAGIPRGSRHLEVGPGHGLLLYLASKSAAGTIAGWDVSETSLANTRCALQAMGVERHIALSSCNLFDAPDREFDSLTFSEVLEHLEEPAKALSILRRLLAEGGQLFVNAPVNSPAPDHIYLFSQPEEIVRMVEDAGFRIDSTAYFPCTGATLERARKQKLAISVVVVATAK